MISLDTKVYIFNFGANTVASDRLADAEVSAERDRKKALRDNHHRSSYPPGAEFALCHAEAQLMAAVVGVLSESVVESMKAFYKLRTAYKTLEGIIDQMSKMQTPTQLDGAGQSTQSLTNGISGGLGDNIRENEPSGLLTPGLGIKGSGASIRSTKSGSKSGSRPGSRSRPSTSHLQQDGLVDEFVTSGVNLCFGVLLLILGMVPPSMRTIMSIVGFRGGG